MAVMMMWSTFEEGKKYKNSRPKFGNDYARYFDCWKWKCSQFVKEITMYQFWQLFWEKGTIRKIKCII